MFQIEIKAYNQGFTSHFMKIHMNHMLQKSFWYPYSMIIKPHYQSTCSK